MKTFNPIFLPQIKGLGNVLHLVINEASCWIIARMDSDDVAAPDRFEKQLCYLQAYSEVGMAGVTLPSSLANFLWIRMQLAGIILGNHKENLVNVRMGKDMYARRGGWKYFCSEVAIQGYMLTYQIISFYNTILCFGGQVVLSNWLRPKVFKMLRQQPAVEVEDKEVNIITKNKKMCMDDNLPPFSVAISVYKNDNPECFDKALESVIVNQTVKPAEVVLVVDGPVPDVIHQVINRYKGICLGGGISFVINWLEVNGGLGNALRMAVESATCDLIARMDSDDIAESTRFEKQLKCFENDSELSIVGGSISEFIDTPQNIVGHRVCPFTNDEIKDYMKSRCGLNHVTVMFRKSEVLRVGNYQDWFWNEDYYLWIRMMLAGCKFANLPDVLVNVRVGKDMYARRGGRKYYNSERDLQKYMLEHKVINRWQYMYNVFVRWCIQIAMPNSIRAFVFQKLLRK